MHKKEGKSEAIILIKAAHQVEPGLDEFIYCAAVTPEGEWLRLYPLSFEKHEDARRFGLWSRVEFDWRAPSDDPRPESRQVERNSLKITGEFPAHERHGLLSKLAATSLKGLAEQGKSLALLQPRNAEFLIERKAIKEIIEEQKAHERIAEQKKPLHSKAFIPVIKFCPYKFKYRYADDDGLHESIYQNLEIDATFVDWSRTHGEEQALARITKVYGEEYLRKSMVFVMGLHPAPPPAWRINTILCMDQLYSMAGHRFDVVV